MIFKEKAQTADLANGLKKFIRKNEGRLKAFPARCAQCGAVFDSVEA
jgi:predicted Zn-ribbon and HTH transcriptional regulator